MKKLLVVPVLLFIFAFQDGDGTEGKRRLSGCHITSCTPNAGLVNGRARIEFTAKDFGGNKITDSIRMSYNGITRTLFPDTAGKATLPVKAGKWKFQFYVNGLDEIYSDSLEIKSGHVTAIELNFSPAFLLIEADKPVIYVYPDVTQGVHIQLDVKGELGFTYPVYPTNGWEFDADPDGTIHINGSEYSYLFWDAQTRLDLNVVDVHKGFIVEKDSLSSFFETKLTAMGLTPRERQDFITYWCPLMQENEKSYVHFMFGKEYSSIATMSVTPSPDHIFRVFMIWSDAAEIDSSAVQEQPIDSFTRSGFSVVEWGGAKTELADVL
ncbi:MAG TPA: hypothetical protein VK826_15370 [Bacteroidia bacterium]|nr:hypothetical protein [Bacteroidia bacterium]